MSLFGLDTNVSIAIIWIGIAVIFAIIEAFTLGLTTIWFSVGAIGGAIVAMFHASVIVQIVVFLVVSCIMIYFTRPLKSKLKIGQEKTNVALLIGQIGTIMSEIKPNMAGQVKLNGMDWTAVGENPNEEFSIGESVEIVQIQGVKLVVKKVNT